MSDKESTQAARRTTQFQKGKSGNPKGRPRSKPEESATPMDVIVARTLTITQNGAPREVTLEEALQHKTYQQAISGSRIAQRRILKMIEQREIVRKKLRGPRPQKVTNLHEDDGTIDLVLELLGIALPNPKVRLPFDSKRTELLLEPWTVALAFRRRKFRHFPWEEERSRLKTYQ